MKRTNCKQCGTELGSRNKTFCSWKCSGEYKRKALKAKCSYCGKDVVKPAWARSKRRHGQRKFYCDKKCYHLGQVGQKRKKWGKIIACEICGNPVKEQHSRTRFCSRRCMGIWRIRSSVGKKVASGGYVAVRLPDHPNASKAGYVLEHRLVMEATLGRHLLPSESVHHINGIRNDNRPGNLQVLDRSPHIAGIAYICLDCGSHNVRPEVLNG